MKLIDKIHLYFFDDIDLPRFIRGGLSKNKAKKALDICRKIVMEIKDKQETEEFEKSFGI